MPDAIGFDVYGTLVDPLQMNTRLEPLAGELSGRLAALWREKQLEYTFRRGLMREYEDFDVCTRQALLFAAGALGVKLSEQERERLIEEYRSLSLFPDVIPGVKALKERSLTLVAFSNGVESTVRALLARAGALPHLQDVISVDDLKTFKPDPDVYRYLTRRLGTEPSETWLVSSNPFDVIGAKAVGLKTAWVRRNPDTQFDPWGIEPDLVVTDLESLAAKL
ncbi:MAG TPA: haloacid dehalogenase type II [Rubrobacteraceae bacterium]|nr:haloacid dehalogenase type II [Rubrobacteraceae bacterium]